MGNALASKVSAREELAGSSPVRPTLMNALDIVGELLKENPSRVLSIGYTYDLRYSTDMFWVIYEPSHPPTHKHDLFYLDTFVGKP